jgi:hypothetical protein
MSQLEIHLIYENGCFSTDICLKLDVQMIDRHLVIDSARLKSEDSVNFTVEIVLLIPVL